MTEKVAGDAASSPSDVNGPFSQGRDEKLDGKQAMQTEKQAEKPKSGLEVATADQVSKGISAVRGKDDKTVHKLGDSAYKPWGSRSRSSSEAGSDTAFCNGGPGKVKCGDPVRDSDQGVQCEKCELWFHAGCQQIPKAAYEALVSFKILSWFCPECKKSVKARDENIPRLETLEKKVDSLGDSLVKHMELVTKSLKDQQHSVENQIKALEKSAKEIGSQKSSYADIVKGSCSEVVEKVSKSLASLPQIVPVQDDPRNMTGIVKAFDSFIDKDRRKNNLVIHNLRESTSESKEEKISGDINLFCDMIKEAFKINVKVSKAFRVGKPVEGRDRLLIITLDTPGVKHDILRLAPLLRSSDRWGNIYITPDLTPAERDVAKKLREELRARRNGGETNLTIRRGRIVHIETPTAHRNPEDGGQSNVVGPVPGSSAGATSVQHQSSTPGGQGTSRGEDGGPSLGASAHGGTIHTQGSAPASSSGHQKPETN